MADISLYCRGIDALSSGDAIPTMRHIEEYTDYREYLRDYYSDQKSRKPFFSYRYFCNKAGISSPSYFKEVTEGKRNLTQKSISAFAKGLQLTDRETQFFTALVQYTQARSAAQKQTFLDLMRGLRKPVTLKGISDDKSEYFSRWYNPVIRELVCLRDWKDDYRALACALRPAIKASEAKQSVRMLLKLGFIRRDEAGRYHQQDPDITTGSEAISLSVRALNRQFSELGTAALDTITPTQRDISSSTLGISRKSYGMIKQEILAFKRRVFQIVDDDRESDTVYNLNVQFFPVSLEPDETHAPQR